MWITTILTFVIAGLGTIVVAWQAYETHRTTSLTHRTLDSSYSMAIDSARSRLDQDAPRVDVYVEQVSVLPGDGAFSGEASGAAARWRLPADGGRLLRVQAQIRVVNLMEHRTIHLRVHGLHDPALQAGAEVLLVPAARLAYSLTATFTLSQWAENWAAQQAGGSLPHVAEGRVIAGDDRDEGVVDTWPLRLTAWPIGPAGDTAETWKLATGPADGDWFGIAIRPLRERSYWISQSRNIPMPEPSYDKPG